MKRAVFVIKKNELHLYIEGLATPYVQVLDPKTYHNLEVGDRRLLKDQLVSFVTKNKVLPLDCVVVISKELLLEKRIPSSTFSVSEYRNFLEQIPLDPTAILTVTLKRKDEVCLCATNKYLLKPLVSYLEAQKWQIRHAVPEPVFGDKVNYLKLDYSVLSESHAFLSSVDFLRDLGKTSSKSRNSLSLLDNFFSAVRNFSSLKDFFQKKSFLKIGFVLMLLGLSIAGYFAIKKLLPAKPNELKDISIKTLPIVTTPTKIETPKALETTQSTESTSSNSETTKTHLRILVLNGTTVPGQASKVKDTLLGIGYRTVSTGNAPSIAITETSVSYSPKVSPLLLGEITDYLSKSFSKVGEAKVLEASNSTSDIVITLGTPKL
jgi:hypothetical protein